MYNVKGGRVNTVHCKEKKGVHCKGKQGVHCKRTSQKNSGLKKKRGISVFLIKKYLNYNVIMILLDLLDKESIL